MDKSVQIDVPSTFITSYKSFLKIDGKHRMKKTQKSGFLWIH